MSSCIYRFAKSYEGQSPVAGPAISSWAVLPTSPSNIGCLRFYTPSKVGPNWIQFNRTNPESRGPVLLIPCRAIHSVAGTHVPRIASLGYQARTDYPLLPPLNVACTLCSEDWPVVPRLVAGGDDLKSPPRSIVVFVIKQHGAEQVEPTDANLCCFKRRCRGLYC
jgi:hypothetical protein